MALREVLDEDVFKMAMLNLVWLSQSKPHDPQSFLEAAAVLRILKDDGRHLAERTDKEVVAAVTKTLHKFVPDFEQWDDPRLHAFLDMVAGFLEDARADSELLRTAHSLCQDMWATLAGIANREMRASAAQR